MIEKSFLIDGHQTGLLQTPSSPPWGINLNALIFEVVYLTLFYPSLFLT